MGDRDFSAQAKSSIGQTFRVLIHVSIQCVWNAWLHVPHDTEHEWVFDLDVLQAIHNVINELRQIEHTSPSKTHDHVASRLF